MFLYEFRELLKNSYCNWSNNFTILSIISDNYQKKYESIIKEMYQAKQNERQTSIDNSKLDPFENIEDEILISNDDLPF